MIRYAVVPAVEENGHHPRKAETATAGADMLGGYATTLRGKDWSAPPLMFEDEKEARESATKQTRLHMKPHAVVRIEAVLHVEHLTTIRCELKVAEVGGSGPFSLAVH